MAKSIIDLIVTDHLAPALEDAGFRRSGRVLRRYNEGGDAVVVDVQKSSGSQKAEATFYINVVLAPVPWLKWIRSSDEPADLRDPDAGEGAVSARVRSALSGSWSNDTWVVRPEEVAERGRAAAQATQDLVAQFLPLLDRAELLRRLEDRSPLPGFCPENATRAILYLDAARFGDAQREIDDIAAYQPDSSFVKWARVRLPQP